MSRAHNAKIMKLCYHVVHDEWDMVAELAAELAQTEGQPLPVEPPGPKPGCPNRGAGHRWLITDYFTERCDACKLTRPRPRSAPAHPQAFGEESERP